MKLTLSLSLSKIDLMLLHTISLAGVSLSVFPFYLQTLPVEANVRVTKIKKPLTHSKRWQLTVYARFWCADLKSLIDSNISKIFNCHTDKRHLFFSVWLFCVLFLLTKYYEAKHLDQINWIERRVRCNLIELYLCFPLMKVNFRSSRKS